MAYASRSGRARVSASNPEAFAVCDRCGFWYNRVDLQNQHAWRGSALLPTWKFVCRDCLDIPNEQDRVFVPPADPLPITLPRPENFAVATSVMGLNPATVPDPKTGIPVPAGSAVMQTTSMTAVPQELATGMTDAGYDAGMTTEDPAQMLLTPPAAYGPATNTGSITMAPVPTGRPPGYAMEAIMPDAVVDGVMTEFGVPLPLTSLISDGSPLVRGTCNGPHGLTPTSQIAVRGSGNPLADGMFTAIPMTATAFAYGAYSPVPAGSLLEPDTVICTARVGLPRDFPALPQTGLPQTHPTKTAQ